ncbi:hypothetical protein J2S54_000020 [Streptomyces sp. DSM 42143]|uniref:hypothetical protein n=1 Tax=Streptomyces sp. DSM 42143 TaxID=2817711 RepID=UPI00278176FA|nr:hypothetical protein [Streptomyces sp. DSM 42143]MDQ0383200.1 hypothetical protein [Streptomyces sp. DSM 42143]
MNTETLPPLDPVELRDQVMAHEEDLRRLVKQLGFTGQYEARTALRDAADLLLGADRSLTAEMSPRHPSLWPARTPHATVALHPAR